MSDNVLTMPVVLTPDMFTAMCKLLRLDPNHHDARSQCFSAWESMKDSAGFVEDSSLELMMAQRDQAKEDAGALDQYATALETNIMKFISGDIDRLELLYIVAAGHASLDITYDHDTGDVKLSWYDYGTEEEVEEEEDDDE